MGHNLTEEQIAEFMEAFALLDKDKSNSIDRNELRELMLLLGRNPTKEEVDNMMALADTNGDGRIDKTEFLELMEKLSKEHDYAEELIESFKIFDRENIGLISSVELRHVLTALGDEVDPAIVEEMIREGDKDGDGHINYNEFVEMMVQHTK